MARREYTRESVARALEIHRYHGRIRSCHIDGAVQFVVVLNDGSTHQLRSLREAYVFVLGLASAAQAPQEAAR